MYTVRFQLVNVDVGNPHFRSSQNSLAFQNITDSWIQRLSRLWMGTSNPKICWWFQTVTLFPHDLTQTARLREIHISLFFAATTSRISLKAQSHAGAEESFRWVAGGGGIHMSEPFTGRLTARRDVRRSEWDVCMQGESGIEKYTTSSLVDSQEGYNWVVRVAVRKMIGGKERRDTNHMSFKIN